MTRNEVIENKNNLSRANLSKANLSKAYLSRADLSGANLSRADLREAYLSGADFSGANLSKADLSRANLSKANLSRANLREAYLSGANLSGTNLRGADLRGAVLPKFQIPQEGTLTVFKKLKDKTVAKLLVPEAAKRTASLVGRKCRAEFVLVLESTGAFDGHSNTIKYIQGTTIYPDKYDDDIRIECTNGIHFFLTREEAEEY